MSQGLEPAAAASGKLGDSEALRALKARDNWTNWRHLASIYLVIAATVALAIAATGWIAAHGHSWGWTVAVNAVAILILGAAQHQFGGAIHELSLIHI